MSTDQQSPAVAIARAHAEAWSKHDFDTARGMLAPDVRVTAVTTAPYPPDTDLVGADDYMTGLIAYAEPIVPGSLQVLSAIGDNTSALLTLNLRMAGGPFGAGAEAPCARLYLIDENGKIKAERIVFFVAAE
jgi:SnoaL-like domain